MSVSRQTTDAYELERMRPRADTGAPLQKVWRRYENSSIPLGLKWSLSIAALIVMSMGLLGSYLIQQQETSYRGQFDRFSAVIVDQFVRISREPLMAGDALSLQVLLQRHVQSHLILGAALHDAKGKQVVEQGVSAPGSVANRLDASGIVSWDWEKAGHTAVSYVSPVLYQDVVAGFLLVSIDRSPLERDLNHTFQLLIISTALMMLAGILLASALAHRLSRPIENLARAGEVLGAQRPCGIDERRDEIGQVLQTFQHLADGYQRKDQAEAALSRYVSPHLAQQVLAGEARLSPGGDSVVGSVLFCDIVGFTELSESREPVEVGALLNDYFGYLAMAAESCGGTVDKFIGDCIMIVFGVPHADPHHAVHAMTCGMLIQHLTRHINELRVERQLATVMFRVGISSGPMLAGNLGSSERMQYTVVGDTVNVAARLCGMAEPGGVLLTGSTMPAGHPGRPDHYRRLGPATLRGRKQGVELVAMDVQAVARYEDADRLIGRILQSVSE